MADISRTSSAVIAYLHETLHTKRWQAGTLDCAVFVSDWIVRLGGRDPIADIRGTYASVKEFRRIIRREGGFIRSCERRFAALREVTEADTGDVAIVLAPVASGRLLPTASLVVSKRHRAVVTADAGIVVAGDEMLPLVRAWRVNA